ncbi:hypothetical protein [Pseudomonas fragariae (ex Marin et al. 2024)]|uniref:hypothetical protein n=1 Tax=Pseudomonas fragariae (ex Marin et al. 2024) TaxID=3080056 RepID=UPI003F7A1E3F
MTLTELLSSAVVSAMVAALVTLRSSERKIEIENVTQERAKWRERIRLNALEVHRASVANDASKLSELHLTFEHMLNPLDAEDNGILARIFRLNGLAEPTTELAEFSKRIALLLKHDWDRAKLEASPWPWPFNKKAKRTKYS